MENRFLNRFNDIVVLNVKTRNMDRFLTNLYKLNIDIYNVNVLNFKEVIIEINECDLDSVKRFSILNKIEIIDYKGRIRRKNRLSFNKTLLFSLFFGLVLLIFLTNVVFSIEINHSSGELRKFVMSELNKNGIHRLQFKKNFNSLEKIKNKILEDNKDKIEWLEINVVGTKYVVKVEERKINNLSTDYKFQDIIATKDGVIKKIIADSGVKVREVNEYVKKGDVIISGNIYLNDKLKKQVKAIGEVYAEVWYKISVEYPIINDERVETGNKKNAYSINFFSNSFYISKNRYKNSYSIKKVIFGNNILPINISKDTIYELENTSGIYTEAESVLNAKNYTREKMNEMLKENEYIINDKVLNYHTNSNTIYMDIFYKVYQNITGVKQIEEKGSE